MRHLLRLALVAVLLSLLAGCIVVPVDREGGYRHHRYWAPATDGDRYYGDHYYRPNHGYRHRRY